MAGCERVRLAIVHRERRDVVLDGNADGAAHPQKFSTQGRTSISDVQLERCCACSIQ